MIKLRISGLLNAIKLFRGLANRIKEAVFEGMSRSIYEVLMPRMVSQANIESDEVYVGWSPDKRSIVIRAEVPQSFIGDIPGRTRAEPYKCWVWITKSVKLIKHVPGKYEPIMERNVMSSIAEDSVQDIKSLIVECLTRAIRG